jgi:hypothetical protein
MLLLIKVDQVLRPGGYEAYLPNFGEDFFSRYFGEKGKKRKGPSCYYSLSPAFTYL